MTNTNLIASAIKFCNDNLTAAEKWADRPEEVRPFMLTALGAVQFAKRLISEAEAEELGKMWENEIFPTFRNLSNSK